MENSDDDKSVNSQHKEEITRTAEDDEQYLKEQKWKSERNAMTLQTLIRNLHSKKTPWVK